MTGRQEEWGVKTKKGKTKKWQAYLKNGNQNEEGKKKKNDSQTRRWEVKGKKERKNDRKTRIMGGQGKKKKWQADKKNNLSKGRREKEKMTGRQQE